MATVSGAAIAQDERNKDVDFIKRFGLKRPASGKRASNETAHRPQRNMRTGKRFEMGTPIASLGEDEGKQTGERPSRMK